MKQSHEESSSNEKPHPPSPDRDPAIILISAGTVPVILAMSAAATSIWCANSQVGVAAWVTVAIVGTATMISVSTALRERCHRESRKQDDSAQSGESDSK